jgi:hypothetical protein
LRRRKNDVKAPPLQNVRAVSINIAGVLPAAPRRGDERVGDAARALDALRFLGCRLAALDTTGGAVGLLADSGLAGFFELVFPSPPAAARRTPNFPALAAALQLAPADVLHAGPDLEADVNAALAAGMRAAWLAPRAHFRPRGAAVLLSRLDELPGILRDADTARLRGKPSGCGFRNLVAMLRGLPEEPPPGPHRRNEEPIRAVGADILRVVSALRLDAAPLDALRRRWAEIVGAPGLASRSEPHRLSPAGALAVHCSDTIVREELRRWHAKAILAAAQTVVSGVKKVTFHI